MASQRTYAAQPPGQWTPTPAQGSSAPTSPAAYAPLSPPPPFNAPLLPQPPPRRTPPLHAPASTPLCLHPPPPRHPQTRPSTPGSFDELSKSRGWGKSNSDNWLSRLGKEDTWREGMGSVKVGAGKAKEGFDSGWRGLGKVGQVLNMGAVKLGASEVWPMDLGSEAEKAARILRTFTHDGIEVPDNLNQEVNKNVTAQTSRTKKIPHEVLAQAHGVVIFSNFRVGWGLGGGSGGAGVVLARRPEGGWSAPSGLLLTTVGIGLGAGLDVIDVVLVLRTRDALLAFTRPRVSLVGELSIAAGPLGASGMLDPVSGAMSVFAYTKSRGFYAQASFDGNIILERSDENARFYNKPGITAKEILTGGIEVPPAATLLLHTLEEAERVFGLPPPLPPAGSRSPSPGYAVRRSPARPGHGTSQAGGAWTWTHDGGAYEEGVYGPYGPDRKAVGR